MVNNEGIKIAIIPAAGLGSRFLPLSKVVAKELLPLGELPLIDYAVEEIKKSGIGRAVFVLSAGKKAVLDYFRKNQKFESFLRENGRPKEFLEMLENLEKKFGGLSFSSCLQPAPRGDGEAILRAKKFVKKQNFAVIFPDDIFLSDEPALVQLEKIFETGQKPVIGLKKVASKEKLSSYGIVKVEKIANRFYKIKEIIEKPALEMAPSDLAIAGRYIFSSEIFGYLRKLAFNKKGEIILADALNLMLKDGKIIYGYEINGEWLECGGKMDWLKSHFYFCLKDKKWGKTLKDFLKKNL